MFPDIRQIHGYIVLQNAPGDIFQFNRANYESKKIILCNICGFLSAFTYIKLPIFKKNIVSIYIFWTLNASYFKKMHQSRLEDDHMGYVDPFVTEPLAYCDFRCIEI